MGTLLSLNIFVGAKILHQLYSFFKISQIFGQNFYNQSGILVALADSDILKFIWLEMIMNTIQFINIQKGR